MDNDVKNVSESTEAVSEDLITHQGTTTEEENVVSTTEPTPNVEVPGSKTQSAQLLKSLQEEREKRRELEAKLAEFSSMSSDDIVSDEGIALRKEIATLNSALSEVKQELSKKDILITHPVLKDKWAEFEDFRLDPENQGMNLRTAAKAFLVEQGLYEAKRPGLEKPTGGPKQPAPVGYTADDVKNLRETNFKKYSELLKDGKIKIQ